ncbi:mannose-1-phosphate guanylyltransferase/mannose-6-phosphate isomerase [Desulfovibrio sp. X2]|uniref:mannose-1-phosphate guanylyltransferase/mannose-6-phosphate isomerase n=1 Tax=Desulfovibrio sp. X2 TaxID=941449 RepID=UPI00035873B3|nr:mannose-1-phosphate guanylyltransferase/mannose-6-phosphate isomerase [Desulfovibrio sp. X2]EPR41727.1 mannose-1-phosphate guanylyltransferase/mannose-6-phosphate isomerase [Desulfovibrio sp. X2]
MQDSAATSPKACEGHHAIILAGGSGTRLWPVSRTLLPKQLMPLGGEKSLLQQTVLRALTVFTPGHIWVVTNEEHVFEVRAQLREIDPALTAQALAEPVGRNTLPAILLGLERVVAQDERACVAVFPSDHMIRNDEGWRASMERALELAASDWFVTFGVEPTKPETGYGYIRHGRELGDGAFEVAAFAEKPGIKAAQAFVDSGEYFWNSGMFVFSAERFLGAVADFQPELDAWWRTRGEAPLTQGYGKLPDISVDYGIAEKIAKQAVVKAAFDWDDLGNWEAIYRLDPKDSCGNAVEGDVLALGCEGNLLLSRGGKLAAVGLRNMIVVQTRDATLICPKDEVQRVKDVVGLLKAQGSPLVEAHVTVNRPWGSYTVLEEGSGYKVKRIMVHPGARLSQQMHHHRSEHWIVIKGTAVAEVDDTEHLLTENQSIDIPKGGRHRLFNPGKLPLEIIEVQSGPYLEEDDIVRFDDIYGRIRS